MTSFFVEMLLPFLLVFVTVFAILNKSKILGEGKQQIDAMVAMVVGLILIGVPGPRDILVSLMPWMSVGVGVLLVFFVLYGFIAGDLTGENMPTPLKYGLGTLAGLFTVWIVLFVTGMDNWILDSVVGTSGFWMNVVMIAAIVGVVAYAVRSSKPAGK